MGLGVGFVLNEFAVQSGKGALVFARRGSDGFLGGLDGTKIAQRLGLEASFGVGTESAFW